MAAGQEQYEAVRVGGEAYEDVAAGQAAQILGGVGKRGDSIARLVVVVSTSATSQVSLQDGANADTTIVPANAPIGTSVIELGIRSINGPWKVTTGAGVTVRAIGSFSD